MSLTYAKETLLQPYRTDDQVVVDPGPAYGEFTLVRCQFDDTRCYCQFYCGFIESLRFTRDMLIAMTSRAEVEALEKQYNELRAEESVGIAAE